MISSATPLILELIKLRVGAYLSTVPKQIIKRGLVKLAQEVMKCHEK